LELNDLLGKRSKEVGPILRRFFTNTLFDSTFTLLGIIIGSAFSSNPDIRLILGTMVATSIALGISTGVSVYESETLERERRVLELEKALFRELENTTITENHMISTVIISVVNFFTPLACCAIVITPVVLAAFQIIEIATASWISIGLALGILFVAGTYFGRLGKRNPLVKGTRMVIFGIVAFVIGYLVQALI
jgi:predicted membrane protein (TIGR00267 family)